MIRLPVLALASTAVVAAFEPNYDEDKVGEFELPELLVTADGSKVDDSTAWENQRRGEILELFKEHVFGRAPDGTGEPEFEVLSVKKDALGGKAVRKLVRIALPEHPEWEGIELMLHLPAGSEQPVPCFVGVSFQGNQAVSPDDDVPLSTRWMRANPDRGIVDHRATEASRGAATTSWPLEEIIAAGFAVAVAYYGDIEPDHPEGWKDGLRGAVGAGGRDGGWSAIGAWAWGLGRMLDYLETDPQVDASRTAVLGHSRLGKAALWAGARDPRFSIVISNNSGEGGAALMRRNYGETTARITRSFPHWFVPRYESYADDPSLSPIDKHMLIALMAPRPVYIASATEDRWADPMGEFLSGVHAAPVYSLYEKEGLGVSGQPAPGEQVGDFIGYHLREGGHALTAEDWGHYLRFAARHWSR